MMYLLGGGGGVVEKEEDPLALVLTSLFGLSNTVDI